jgi:polyisoprenoid-binding protein YceI
VGQDYLSSAAVRRGKKIRSLRASHALIRGCAIVILALASGAALGFATCAAAQDAWTPVEIRGGSVSFDVDSNVSAINVHGRSRVLDGRGDIRDNGTTIAIDRFELTVPVNSLETGMSVRDSHMRKYVFTTADGQTPDLRFNATKTSCPANGNQATCQIAGDLLIRALARPFVLSVKVTRDGGSYHAAGDGIVKLSTYNIDRPSQLGVQMSDEVKLHVELTAKPVVVSVAFNPRGR